MVQVCWVGHEAEERPWGRVEGGNLCFARAAVTRRIRMDDYRRAKCEGARIPEIWVMVQDYEGYMERIEDRTLLEDSGDPEAGEVERRRPGCVRRRRYPEYYGVEVERVSPGERRRCQNCDIRVHASQSRNRPGSTCPRETFPGLERYQSQELESVPASEVPEEPHGPT